MAPDPRVRNYVFQRLLIAIPSLLLASVIVFALPRLIPGDVVQLMLEEKAYGKDLAELRAKLGLDRPIPVQYVAWMGKITRGDFGESLWTRRPVLGELARRLPVTLTLGGMAIAVAILIGIPVGIVSAVRQDGVLDFFARSGAILGLSIPSFVKAIVVILLPAMWWGWTPLMRFTDLSNDPAGYLLQFLLPAIILGIASAAGIMRLTRGMLLEVLRQDYVRTAWAKGLRESVVVFKHGLKNAIIPVVTVLGLQVAQIAGGAVIIEQIFGLPGMGQFLVEAIIQRDYPVIQGINLLVVLIIVATNLLVDLTYAVMDPRIRY
ncbi:MAG TPA: ABC transporter permease [Methylomirabilota bacterium]|nr:ABC transporter permease [Methylomirabilota bacterium]